MKNKNVGYLISGIAIIMAALVLIFNYGVKDIIGATCSHGPSCSMYTTLAIQTWISLAIVGIILIIGLFFIPLFNFCTYPLSPLINSFTGFSGDRYNLDIWI